MSHTNHPPMMTLQQAFELLRARIPAARLVGDGATPLARVHTDTRTLQAGDLFVALKGERFDANSFLSQAGAAGAAAAIAHGGLQAAGLPGIEVPDTLAALGALASSERISSSIRNGSVWAKPATGTMRRIFTPAPSDAARASMRPMITDRVAVALLMVSSCVSLVAVFCCCTGLMSRALFRR